jgi:hypothetical protein
LKTDVEEATGVTKVRVNSEELPEMVATVDEYGTVKPAPLTSFTTATVDDVLNIESGDLSLFPYALMVKSTPSHVLGIPETFTELK